MSNEALHWSIDSMVKRDTTVFSYGWVFNETKSIQRLTLLQIDQDGSVTNINVDYGKIRDDVASYFSQFEHAANSGYVVYGSFSTLPSAYRLQLLCTYQDGTSECIDIPESHYIHSNSEENKAILSKKVAFKQMLVLIKRGLMLLKGGNISVLCSKIKRYRSHIPVKELKISSDISKILTLKEREKMIFFLDHDLGGGANHYRNQLIHSKIAEGYSALVLAFDIKTLSYKLLVMSETCDAAYKIPNEQFIFDMLSVLAIKEIVYNTGVSFINPETIPGFLLDMKLKTKAKLTTLAHDFFPICPSHFLINDKGKYCDIPTPDVCQSCLKNNTFGFTTLFEAGDIKEWRDQWGGLIIASDKFVTFSQSTLDIYRRAYPQLQPENTLIAPHVVGYMPRRAEVQQKERLRIGVVGQIGFHKGAEFVKQLAYEIKKTELPADIVIIGAIEASCPSGVVTQTGPYKQSDLPDLLEDNGVNIILFPSIWPETFSYVVQEMVELGYPIACFNLGAPAERLKNYQKGLILSSMSAGNVLQELIKFHRKIYTIQ
ncbi:glycosyltransferase [Klebsiella aerogenes]|uniref:glycosyltransferase n=1 Tax=Klebsiella aerogenes TaxID=548 RepID=UPI002A80EA6C|nr:glycosyltransferase [Klebsiella aerogenes]WPS00314.1 glycosyltransferase [Klebsiella aerogenes]WPS39600.1 glycosyltransferase [Klebsiella aerogenes]